MGDADGSGPSGPYTVELVKEGLGDTFILAERSSRQTSGIWEGFRRIKHKASDSIVPFVVCNKCENVLTKNSGKHCRLLFVYNGSHFAVYNCAVTTAGDVVLINQTGDRS